MGRRATEPDENRFAIFAVLVTLLCVVSGASDARAATSVGAVSSPLRTLVHVEVAGTGDDAALVFVTDSPPNFTSVQSLSPPSVILDFPETRVAPTVPRSGSKLGLPAPSAPKGAVDGDDAQRGIVGWTIHLMDDSSVPLTRVVVEIGKGRDFVLDSVDNRLTLRTVPQIGRPSMALVTPRLPGHKDAGESEGFVDAGPSGGEVELAESDGLKSEPTEPEAQLSPEAPLVAEAKVNDGTSEKVTASPQPAPADPPEVISERADSTGAGSPGAKSPQAVVAQASPPSTPTMRTESTAPPVLHRSEPGVEQRPSKKKPGARPSAVPSSQDALIAVENVLFRKTESGARLSIRTAAPVEYSIRETTSGGLVLELKDSHIPLAINRFPLDTRFFGTAVTRVVPKSDSVRRRVSIHIDLSREAAYRAHRDSHGLVVEFLPPRSDLSAELVRSGDGHP